jgi:hypothetical protein
MKATNHGKLFFFLVHFFSSLCPGRYQSVAVDLCLVLVVFEMEICLSPGSLLILRGTSQKSE